MEIEYPNAQGMECQINAASKCVPFVPNPHLQREAVRYLLRCVGENPDRNGLLDTPRRVVSALEEMTSGRLIDPIKELSTVFEESCDEMVLVRGIRFVSLCEHHLLPFVGEMVVGYIPRGKVVGLSKIPRMVEAWAQRLSMQERLTNQVCETMQRALDPVGVGVVAVGSHACMGCRGVKQYNADMVTSSLLGLMREPAVRAEFFSLARVGM